MKVIGPYRKFFIRLDDAQLVNFYQSQIEEAERRGMDAFDSDRLLARRKKK